MITVIGTGAGTKNKLRDPEDIANYVCTDLGLFSCPKKQAYLISAEGVESALVLTPSGNDLSVRHKLDDEKSQELIKVNLLHSQCKSYYEIEKLETDFSLNKTAEFLQRNLFADVTADSEQESAVILEHNGNLYIQVAKSSLCEGIVARAKKLMLDLQSMAAG